jgi:hypothetical protein
VNYNIPQGDIGQYLRKGYTIIGISNFNSGEIKASSQSKLKEAAKDIGAEVVLWNQVYTNTVSGTTAYNYYTPQTQTSNYSGNISNNYRPMSSYNYSGSITTYSQVQNTAYVPYSIRRYNYSADYHIKQIDDLRLSLDQSLLKNESQQIHNNTTAYGNLYTRKLDYEFQAFILKIRAPLDYFNAMIRICYKEVNSNYFTDLTGNLPSNLALIYKKYKSDLNDDLILSNNKKTARNLLSHQKYITLGTINTFHGKDSEESFLILNTGKKIELKHIQKFLFEKRDVVANFLIASIWTIIK